MRHVDPITPAADAIPVDPTLADPHARAHALVERQLQVLTRLAEIGMAIAEATERWALAAVDEADASSSGFRGDPGLVYSRVARAVRLTLMLQTRLLKEMPALGRAETLAKSAQEEARRERAHRLTMRAIRAEHDDADDIEQLSGDAWERLRDEDFGDDLGDRPLGEVVARICHDLGLSPDWGVRAIGATTTDPLETAPDRHPRAEARSAADPRTQRLQVVGPSVQVGAAGPSGLRRAPPEDDAERDAFAFAVPSG